MSIDDGYVDVATRIAQFRAKHPKGSLCPFDVEKPYEIVTIEGKTFVVVVASAYRDADDVFPGVGMAWEPFPGQSPYTEDSELQNAQTGAWGRAIVAALAADTSKSIASMEDVRNRVAAEKKDTPAPAEKPKVKRAPPKVAAKPTADNETVATTEETPAAPPPVVVPPTEVDDPVDEARHTSGPPLDETQDQITGQGVANVVNESADPTPERVACADCGGAIESDDQVDLSALRFRRPLCRTCFIAAKRPASVTA